VPVTLAPKTKTRPSNSRVAVRPTSTEISTSAPRITLGDAKVLQGKPRGSAFGGDRGPTLPEDVVGQLTPSAWGPVARHGTAASTGLPSRRLCRAP
jgi:hypothetical protein